MPATTKPKKATSKPVPRRRALPEAPPEGEKLSPEAAEREAQLLTMLQLRAAGATYAAIGKQLGLSESTVWRRLDAGLRETRIESATTYRVLAVERLNRLLMVEWPAAVDASSDRHYQALDRSLTIMRDINRVLGLDDAPPLGMDTADLPTPEGGAKMVIGLTRDEYFEALRAVRAKQDAEFYVDPDDMPDDMDVAEAEIVE